MSKKKTKKKPAKKKVVKRKCSVEKKKATNVKMVSVPCETPIKPEDALNPKQKLFCKLFATHKEFFGNGTQSYIEAYDVPLDKYSSAGACASRLLKDVKILAHINKVIEETGFSDEFADKQLSFLMTQNADFKSKLGAIKEYNGLKQRITKKLKIEDGIVVDKKTLEAASKALAKDIAKELRKK